MLDTIKIGGRPIGHGHPPFIIAEMSGNHNQSLERALKLVDAAAEAGCSALKLQTYTADSITLNHKGGNFEITDKDSLWRGENLYNLYTNASTPWEWHKAIFERAKERGILSFSSPFDESAVDFLEELNVPAYKIASFENSHLPLIRKVASTGKPIIISTGLATLGELDEAVDTVRQAGGKDLILLKCTSTYPAKAYNTNIATIPHMSQLFDCHVGLSDHTLGIGVSVASIALGSCVIEKHFCLSREDGGVDSAFSLEPDEFKMLVDECCQAWEALGVVSYGPTKDEEKSLAFRRSLYISEDLEAGTLLSEDNVRVIRPSGGLHPRHYEEILGKRIRVAVKKGTPLEFKLIS